MPRRRRFRSNYRRARSFIRRTVSSMGPIIAKRGVIDNATIPAITSAVYDNPLKIDMLTALETTNEETEFTDTASAECPIYSKVVALKLNFVVHGLAASERCRWILYKNEDSEDSITDCTDTHFHNSNDNAIQRENRSLIMAKGILIGSDKTAHRLPLFVKRATLKRLGNMKENDQITLVIASSGQAQKITGFGTIYVRAN